MKYENKVEEAASMFVSLDEEDSLAIENIIARMLSKKENVQCGTKK